MTLDLMCTLTERPHFVGDLVSHDLPGLRIEWIAETKPAHVCLGIFRAVVRDVAAVDFPFLMGVIAQPYGTADGSCIHDFFAGFMEHSLAALNEAIVFQCAPPRAFLAGGKWDVCCGADRR